MHFELDMSFSAKLNKIGEKQRKEVIEALSMRNESHFTREKIVSKIEKCIFLWD